MVTLTKPQSRLIWIASILGILQGMAWSIMSLICIILYFRSKDGYIPKLSQNMNYMDAWNLNVFGFLLYGNQDFGKVLNATSFTIFMWIYLFSSAILSILSVIVLRAVNHFNSTVLVNVMKAWTTLTGFISFVDFLLVVLIGAELDQNCAEPSTDTISCGPVLVPLLVIAARGFVLWVVNVVFAYIIFKIAETIQTGKNVDRKLLGWEGTIPRATIQSEQQPNHPQPHPNYSPQQPNFGRQQPNYPRQPLQNYPQQSSLDSPNAYKNNVNPWNNPRQSSYDPRMPPAQSSNLPYQQQQGYPRY